MKLERIDGADPREVLRGVRHAVLGAGPAIALGAPEGAALPEEVPPGTAVVITTSGSTGYPKAVAIGRNALIASALATSTRIGEGAWLLALPPAYIAGVQVLVRSLLAGREPAILSGAFRPQGFVAAARSMASSVGGVRVPTYTSLVPAQLATLLDAAAHDEEVGEALRSFAAILVGGQALAPALAERAAAAGARIVRTYGSSETSGGCVYDGRPLDGVRLRISAGELHVTGPMLADGYLGDPERTAAAFVSDPDGTRWYRTGDTGEIDEGMLRITGRRDHVIVSGGINVSLDRVERAVRAVPGLEEAVVVGVPEEKWGEASVVLVPRYDGAEERELLERARQAAAEEVGRHARPSRLVLVAEMPLLASGKPDRLALREIARDR